MATTDAALAAAEDVVRARKRAGDDCAPLLLIVRDGRIVAVIEATQVPDLVKQLPLAAAGLGADAVVLAFEGVAPVTEANPLTGQPWAPGEAEAVRVQHDGVAEGWVQELVVVVTAVRDGEVRTAVYAISVVEGELHWDASRFESGRIGLEVDLEQALARPILDPATVRDPGPNMVASADAPYLSAEQGRLTLDIGCVRTIDRQLTEGRAALVARDDHEELLLLSEGLAQWQLVR